MISYTLAPNPKWYFLNALGKPASGGTITTFSSLDHSTPKFVFSDPLGLFPYTDPILLDATGGSPVPMYWQINGVDLYYVVVKDAAGNIILTIDNFPTSNGGITPITSNIDIENHLVNGQFLFIDAANEAESVFSPVPAGSTHIAPGSGFYKNIQGQYVRDLIGNVSGWFFNKVGGAGATDRIEFVAETLLGEGFPNAPSANATRYFRYQLLGIGAAITDAALINRIPNVELFQNELLTISFDHRSDVTANGLVTVEQFFGTGGAPSPRVTVSQTFPFSNGAWARHSFQITVPSIVGKSKGTQLDDSLLIRWAPPLNTLGTFDFCNLQVQRGMFGLTPYIEQTYAQDQYKVLLDIISSSNLIFSTGELKWMSAANPGGTPINIPGWLPITSTLAPFIGNTGSGAPNTGKAVRNLYIAWWDSFPQSECIVTGGRGASALADFNANKNMSAPQHIINTVLAAAGNGLFANVPFGFSEGERNHILTIPEMPSHTHDLITGASTSIEFFTDSGGNGVPAFDPGTETTTATGGGGAHNNMQPTFYLWVYVKL